MTTHAVIYMSTCYDVPMQFQCIVRERERETYTERARERDVQELNLRIRI